MLFILMNDLNIFSARKSHNNISRIFITGPFRQAMTGRDVIRFYICSTNGMKYLQNSSSSLWEMLSGIPMISTLSRREYCSTFIILQSSS